MTNKLVFLVLALITLLVLAPSLSYAYILTPVNQTVVDKNFQTCYTTVTQAMIKNESYLQGAFPTVPIKSLKDTIIQNLNLTHTEMKNVFNPIVGPFYIKIQDCIKNQGSKVN